LDGRTFSKSCAIVIKEESRDYDFVNHPQFRIRFDVKKQNLLCYCLADFRFDDTYETQYGQHTPMEPHVTMGYIDPEGRLVIMTSTQVPFHARRIAAQTIGVPVRKIRVIKPRVGGAFGGKQEILQEEVCGALTLRTGSPVRWEMSREEAAGLARRIWSEQEEKKPFHHRLFRRLGFR